MVRVVFIRHGMTHENLHGARMAIRIAKGQVDPADREAISLRERMEEGPSEASGDTQLSDHKGGGVREARLLGEYWAPMLREYAELGKLHVYVSAMQRCMQTADPLLRALGVDATIEPKVLLPRRAHSHACLVCRARYHTHALVCRARSHACLVCRALSPSPSPQADGDSRALRGRGSAVARGACAARCAHAPLSLPPCLPVSLHPSFCPVPSRPVRPVSLSLHP